MRYEDHMEFYCESINKRRICKYAPLIVLPFNPLEFKTIQLELYSPSDRHSHCFIFDWSTLCPAHGLSYGSNCVILTLSKFVRRNFFLLYLGWSELSRSTAATSYTDILYGSRTFTRSYVRYWSFTGVLLITFSFDDASYLLDVSLANF